MTDTERTYFTADEANKMLPLVQRIVRDIVDLYRDVHERRERLEMLRRRSGASRRTETTPYSEEVEHMEQEIDRDIDRLNDFTSELHRLGVELKDPVQGLVDFYARMDGRDVYLCWKLGEDEVGYWHELDGGFGGRQSLLEGSFPGPDADDGGETT